MNNPPSHGSIGLLSALAIAIGGMVGGGIFAVQGEAILLAKEATPLAFTLGGILALVTAYSYVKLILYFQDEGGTAVFIRQAFGQNILTETVNLLLWVGYLVSISLYADAFGDHVLALLGIGQDHRGLKHVFTTLAIFLPALLNLSGISIISRTENIAVIIKLSILVFVAIMGLITLGAWPTLPAIQPHPLNTFTGMAVASAFIFIAFQGFELLANTINDIKRPSYTLPRALYGSVILTSILYLLINLTVIHVEPLAHIADIKETVLAEAARPLLGNTGYTLISIATILSTLAAITMTLYGIDRLGRELAKEKELPAILLAGRGWKSFLLRLFLLSSIAGILANTLSLDTTAMLASGLFLVVFGVVNAAALELSTTIGANRWLPLFGLVSSLFVLTAMVLYANTHLPNAALIFLNTLLATLLFRTLCAVHRQRQA